MAKSRDAIRITEDELPALYAECKSLQLATLGKDGAPHLTTVWYAVHEGAFLFETYGKSQKVVNMRRDPRVALLLEAGTEYSQLRGVSMQGRAEIVDHPAENLRLMTLIVDHHFPGQAPETLAQMAARMAEKRVVVSIRPDKTISWDHRKLGGKGP
jgi:PPOX class probable F420-dependent enzyme